MVFSRIPRRSRAFCLEGGTRRPRRVAGEVRPLATPARRDVTLHLKAGTVTGVFSKAPLGDRICPHPRSLALNRALLVLEALPICLESGFPPPVLRQDIRITEVAVASSASSKALLASLMRPRTSPRAQLREPDQRWQPPGHGQCWERLIREVPIAFSPADGGNLPKLATRGNSPVPNDSEANGEHGVCLHRLPRHRTNHRR